MANINKLEMASAVAAHGKITEKKSFFGSKFIYQPTGSALKVRRADFPPEDYAKLERLLGTAPERLSATLDGLKLRKVPVGNVRLEGAVAADGQFAAVQILRFGDYLYRPVGEVRFFEGPSAAVVASIF